MILMYLIVGGVLLLVMILLFIGYKKAPPDTAFIVSGIKKRIAIGKAVIRIPFFERIDKLSLMLVPIDVKTSSTVPTADFIHISIDAAVNVKIGSSSQLIQLASENFLNRDIEYIAFVAREVLEGNMREIVGKMKLEEMVSDRQKFAELVRENASPDLAAMGLEIVSFNVQNFIDSNSIIEDLGIDNITQIKKTAAIAKAKADKEIAIAKAEADKDANDARVNADSQIAKRKTDFELQKAELKIKEDTAKAQANAAYEIQSQEQRKTIEIASAEADIAAQTKKAEIKAREVEVQEQTLNAEINKKADAELYKRKKEAEAELYERQKQAEANKYEKEQEAEGIRKVGEAEAEAIRQKGLAQAEAMEKQAEAYQKYNNAAIAEMLIKVMPDIAAKIAEPLGRIDKITIVGGGEGNSVDSVAGNVPIVMGRVFESVKEATGIDLKEIVRADTYDAKVNKNITFDGAMPVMPIKTDKKDNVEMDNLENTGAITDSDIEEPKV